MTMYLQESWYMGDEWYEDWVCVDDSYSYPDVEDWDFGVDPDRLTWFAPSLVEENCVIWNKE